MIESFEYNNHYKSQQPCASYNIFVAALEVGHFYAVLEWCWESDDDTSFHVRTYVDRSKADEIIVDEETDDILAMSREEIYSFLEQVNYETELASRTNDEEDE